MSTNIPKADPVDGYVLTENKPADDKPTFKRIDNLDGYQNVLTGLGDPNQDKLYGGNPLGGNFVVTLLPGVACEDRWRGSDLGARLVETVPSEMVREGWEITIQPTEEEKAANEAAPEIQASPPDEGFKKDAFPSNLPPAFAANALPAKGPKPLPEADSEGPAIVEALEAKQRDLRVLEAVRDALNYERAYGGAGILVGVDDGQALTEPLKEDKIKSIKFLTAFRGGWDGELIAWRYYNNPTSARFGEPEIYMLRNLGVPIAPIQAPLEKAQPEPIPTGPTGPLTFWIHESRLIVFPGVAVSRRARVQMRGWGDSIFTRVDEVLSQYSQTWQGVANLMTDWAQGVLKVAGLADLLAGQDPSAQGTVAKRMVAINMSKSIARTMLIDATEDFKREATPLTGIADVLQAFALRLAAAADMPVTLLMGQAPSGLNATGASDVRFFYDRIAAKQRDRLQPQLHKLIRLLMLAKDGPTKGVEPEKWSLKMHPLWQPTDLETSQLRKTVAETDKIYIDSGVLTAEEVAASVYGGSSWSMERTIDHEARQEEADKPIPEPMAAQMTPAMTEPDPAKEETPATPAAEKE